MYDPYFDKEPNENEETYGGNIYGANSAEGWTAYGTGHTPEDPVFSSRESSYSDSTYSPINEAQRQIPRYYYEDSGTGAKKKDGAKKEKTTSGFTMGKFIAVALICALLGGVIGAGGVSLFSARNDSVAESAGDYETRQPDENDSSRVDLSGGSEEDVPSAPDSESDQTETPVLTASAQRGGEMSASDIYDLSLTQVVGITTEITYTNYFGMTTSAAVSGTGFIVSEDGYIITNNHVIEDAAKGGYEVSVMLYNGDTYTAAIVGREEENDIAVLKIDASGLNPVTIADSDEMRVGETVYAVGNPLGELIYTMTTGTVSALDREIATSDSSYSGSATTINVFQIDAAVNSGNSGGPVYNTSGEVIGVVTAKYSSTGVEGIGFAIPINDAVSIANELINNGYVSGKPYFGISVNTVTDRIAEYYNMVVGACIIAVDSNSCAAEAGLKVGDIITAIDGKEITSSSDLVSAKKDYKAGDTAVLTVYRSGEVLTLTIVFDEEVPATSAAAESAEEETPTEEYPTFGEDGILGQLPGFPSLP